MNEGVVRERDESKMPRFSGGWEDGDSIRRGGWRGKWWVELWVVLEEP